MRSCISNNSCWARHIKVCWSVCFRDARFQLRKCLPCIWIPKNGMFFQVKRCMDSLSVAKSEIKRERYCTSLRNERTSVALLAAMACCTAVIFSSVSCTASGYQLMTKKCWCWQVKFTHEAGSDAPTSGHVQYNQPLLQLHTFSGHHALATDHALVLNKDRK